MSENDDRPARELADAAMHPVPDELTEAEREFADTMTPEQWARFELMLEQQRKDRQPKEVSPAERVQADPPRLGPTMDQILAALEAAVMVVRPGEVLAVRVPPWLNSDQISNYQRSINELLGWHGLIDVHVLVLPGEEFAKLKPSSETLASLLRPGQAELPPVPVSDLRPTMAQPAEPPPTGPQPVQQ
ncbi:MAG TPA: hypothetical protein VMU95_41120 [Trebonia sp.]|nr:hypothetical protein [Trebonia sp.]